MANAAELTTSVATLEERVANHIKFFWIVVSFGIAWLGTLTALIVQIDTTVARLGKTQTEQIAATTLTTVRDAIDLAERRGQVIPEPQLASYKGTLRTTPPSTPEYWTTLASIVNYQSLVDHSKGKAPSPRQVATPCLDMENGSAHNLFQDGRFSGCIVDIDGATFVHTVFTNSVIRYHGGAVALIEVSFKNCSFVLDIPPLPAGATPPAQQQQLLSSLLHSSDQTDIKISTQS